MLYANTARLKLLQPEQAAAVMFTTDLKARITATDSTRLFYCARRVLSCDLQNAVIMIRARCSFLDDTRAGAVVAKRGPPATGLSACATEVVAISSYRSSVACGAEIGTRCTTSG